MTAAVRTDAHRPSALDPADYAWVGFEDAHEGDEYLFEFDWERYRVLRGEAAIVDEKGRSVDGVPEDIAFATATYSGGRVRAGGCVHCGQTRIRYWTFYLHKPTGEVVAVGSSCAAKLSLDSRDDIERRAAVERQRLTAKLDEWRAADEKNELAIADLLAAEDAAGGSGGAGNDFTDSLLRYARKNGYLTEAQRDAVLKGIETRKRREEERAERAEEAGDPEPSPVIEGRIDIEGRIVAMKNVDSVYGSTTKMLVLDDRGFKVWGTFPDGLTNPLFERAVDEGATDIASWIRAGGIGRIRFRAAVERSRDDETFGFFKRPTKAEAITNEGE